MWNPRIMLIGNFLTAAAYYMLTIQLLLFWRRFQLLPVYITLSTANHPRTKLLFGSLLALALLFPMFIALCGVTHTLSAIDMLVPESSTLHYAMNIVMLSCAAISIVTAIVGYHIFPGVLDVLRKFQLSSEGNLESAQTYQLEIVELIKESMMEISDDGNVVRCNEASKFLFDKNVIGCKVTNYIHPDDVALFNGAMLEVLSSYNRLPSTVEYRILCNENTVEREPVLLTCPMSGSRWNMSDARVHCDIELGSVSGSLYEEQGLEDLGDQVVTMAMNNFVREHESKVLAQQQQKSDVTYIWVESTMCKGVRLNDSGQLEYDIKLATRSIIHRK